MDRVGRGALKASADVGTPPLGLGCSRYAWRMQQRRGSGLFGVPAMIALLVVAAVVPNVHGVGGLLIAVVAALVAFLIIGAAITLAGKS